MSKSSRYLIPNDALVPLKVWYLANLIKHGRGETLARRLTTWALEQCAGDRHTSYRKAFYLLLNCELVRGSDEWLASKQLAQTFCASVSSGLFANYAKVVRDAPMNGLIHSDTRPLELLKIDRYSEDDLRFLTETSLAQIIRRHFGKTPPHSFLLE